MRFLINKRVFIFLFTFFVWDVSFADAYPYRDIKKPVVRLNEYDKIVILSSPRTGSTVVYAVCQYLFENVLAYHLSLNKKVIKTHGADLVKKHLIKFPKMLVVIPKRDPFDAFLSRICLMKNLQHNIPKSDVDLRLKNTIKSYNSVLNFVEQVDKKHILSLEFQDFKRDVLHIVKSLEEKLNIVIPVEEKKFIEKSFNKSSVKKIIKKYKNFGEFDPILGFHGNHIQDYKKTLKEVLSEELYNQVREQLNPICQKLNYPLR